MRILVISQFYTPDITAAAFRISETVDFLKQQGNEVRVITTHPHKVKIDSDEIPEPEPSIHRVRLAPEEGGGLRHYLQHYLSFVYRSSWEGLLLRRGKWRPDVIWTSSPPLFTGLTGRFLARIFRCPLVFDIRDIWPDSAVAAQQISGNGSAFKIGKLLEQRLYNGADHITCVSVPMSEYIRSQTRTPVTVIYNGISNVFSRNTTTKPLSRRILYAGNLGRVQGLDVVVRAFSKSVADGLYSDWTLEFIGTGALEEKLKFLVAQLGMEKQILFHPPIGKQEVLHELAASSLVLINLTEDDVFKLTIPSKVFDYMIVNRPILFGIDGEGRELMDSTGGNIGFLPSDEQSLLEALRIAWTKFDDLQEKARHNSDVISEKYTREANAIRLLSVFNSLIGSSK